MKSARIFTRKRLDLAVLLIAIVLTLLAWKVTGNLVNETNEKEFIDQVNREEKEINFQLDLYFNTLLGIKGFFTSSDQVSRSEFSTYIYSLNIHQNLPGIYGFSYISRVSASDSAVFLTNLENELIQAKINGKVQRTLSNEAEHFIVNYVALHEDEPRLPYGYDLKVDSERKITLEKARDLGEPVASDKITIIGPEKSGFIIALPLYQQGRSIKTVEERREALVGFINALIIYEDLFKSILEEDEDKNLKMYMKDGENLIYEKGNVAVGSYANEKVINKKIIFAKRVWDLNIFQNQEEKLGNRIPIIVLVSGLTFSFILFGFFYFLISSEARAKKLAEKMNSEFKKSQEKFEMYMDSTSVVAWLKETKNWKYTYINKSFEETFNISKSEIQEKTDFDLYPKEIAEVVRANDLLVFNENKSIQKYENVPLPNGELHKWLVYKFPITTTDGERFVGGTAIDVTEQKNSEDELKKNKEELEKVNNLMVGRELKMIELKEEVAQLKSKGGQNEDNR